jgi:hypothetical protein
MIPGVDDHWRWADPTGQQRRVRTDELRAALASGIIAPNAPVWKPGWKDWQPAHSVPELTTSALSAANGVIANIPPPPLAVVSVQADMERKSVPPPPPVHQTEPPPPPFYEPMMVKPAPPTPPSNPAQHMPAPPPSAPASAPASKKAPTPPPVKISAPPPLPGKPSKPPPPVPSKKPEMPPAPAIVAKKENIEELSGSMLVADDASSGRLPIDPASVPTILTAAPVIPQPAPSPMPAPAFAPPVVAAPAPTPPPPEQPQPAFPPVVLEAAHTAQPAQRPIQNATLVGGISPISLDALAPAAAAAPAPAPAAPLPEPLPPLAPGELPPPPAAMMAVQEKFEAEGRALSQPPPPMGVGPSDMRTQIGGMEAPKIPPPGAMPGNMQGGLPAPTVPTVDSPPNSIPPEPMDSMPPPPLAELIPGVKLPKLPPAVEKLAAKAIVEFKRQKAKNKMFVPVAAVIVGMVAILFLALFVSAIRSCGKSDDSVATADSASPSASTSTQTGGPPPVESAAPPPAESVVAPSDNVRAPAPSDPSKSVAFDKCALEGSPSTVGSRAMVAAGLEAMAKNPGFAIGFATGPHDGAAVPLDASLGPGAPSAVHSPLPVKRIVPYIGNGMLVGIADADRRGDKLVGRRTVIGSSAIDFGVSEGAIAWAPHGTDTFASLFTIGPDAQQVEALRGVPLAMEKGFAIAFRRGGAIWLGIATGDNVLTPKRFSTIQGLSGKVGSPSIAVSGDAVVVAWADRASVKDPWGIRVARFSPKDSQPVVNDFTPPAGGPGNKAMSPAVAGIGGGKYLLAWSEGPAKGERIRAVNMSGDNQPLGEAFSDSPEDANAGQPQIAIGNDGKGIIAYLVEHAGGYDVSAQGIACAKSGN